jgi:hypothetical protein
MYDRYSIGTAFTWSVSQQNVVKLLVKFLGRLHMKVWTKNLAVTGKKMFANIGKRKNKKIMINKQKCLLIFMFV